MNAFRQYWSFSAIRGSMTLLAAVAIAGVPYFAHAILPIPLALGFAIDCLAAYALLDAGALFLLGISLPAQRRRSDALFVQAAASIVLGGLLFVVTHGELTHYFLCIVTLHAVISAIAELNVARRTLGQYRCLSCYATAMVLAACAVAIPFTGLLDTAGQLLALSTYIGFYGATQLALAARMLFVEYRAEHPAPHLSEAWRAEMFQPLPDDRPNPAFARRGLRTANVFANGYVVPGHARIVPSQSRAA